MLGISPSAWEEARSAMGDRQASVVLAAILQRGPAIRSPGGYLRILARRAATGDFSVWPMLMALRRQGRATETPSRLPSRTMFRKGDPACLASIISVYRCAANFSCNAASVGLAVKSRASAVNARFV